MKASLRGAGSDERNPYFFARDGGFGGAVIGRAFARPLARNGRPHKLGIVFGCLKIESWPFHRVRRRAPRSHRPAKVGEQNPEKSVPKRKGRGRNGYPLFASMRLFAWATRHALLNPSITLRAASASH